MYSLTADCSDQAVLLFGGNTISDATVVDKIVVTTTTMVKPTLAAAHCW
jgi:hypothetical protein